MITCALIHLLSNLKVETFFLYNFVHLINQSKKIKFIYIAYNKIFTPFGHYYKQKSIFEIHLINDVCGLYC